MSKRGREHSPDYIDRFSRVYNDTEAYPRLVDAAAALGLSYQSVRNRASEIRRQNPDALVSRVAVPAETEEMPPEEHARRRANALRADVQGLLTGTRYPVVNPEAILVESFLTRRYDRLLGHHIVKEGTPRTWLTDTLRVEDVEDPRGRTFIFTGAQNDAPVHAEFWRNLQAYAGWLDADIVVGPWTYETQWWSENNPTSRSYDALIADHLCFGQMEIGGQFVFCGEMNVLPTAAKPISDLGSYSRGRWTVFPHAKHQLNSVPSTDPTKQAHQVMTTGAVTRPKVIARKAGIKSIFHHILGAVIVEFDEEGDLFCRQISADDDGTFYDLDRRVESGDISRGHAAAALVAGDIHTRKADPANLDATLRAPTSMLTTLRPNYLFLHDLHDNEARNHHHIGDNAYSYEMAVRGRDNVIEEVRVAVDLVLGLEASETRITVVDSNHDLALERYVREGRYRNDGINIRVGLKLEDAYLDYRERLGRALDSGQPAPTFSLLEWTMRHLAGAALDHVSWVHDGQSFVVGDVECGHHGFRGANGAQGTVAGYARLGRKMSIADKHSPQILDGVFCAGVMALHHGYNRGPSGWAVANIVQYPNGKRTLVTLQRGKWCVQRDCSALRSVV